MPRKTTILIVILAAITGILIFLAVRSDTAKDLMTNSDNGSLPTATPAPQPYATLSFGQDILDLSLIAANQTVDVKLDTAGKPVAGVQIELSYDSRALTNVKLLPAAEPFFGPNSTVLINNVDPEQGRISYAVAISPEDSEKTGMGTVVRIAFTANRAVGVPVTRLSFLPKSTVTTLTTESSILKAANPLQIILTASTPAAN